MGSDLAAGCCFGCLILVTLVIHAVGFFTPHWAETNDCDSRGLFYSCCRGSDNSSCEKDSGNNVLDVRVLGLQATTLAIMGLTFVGLCCGSCCSRDDDNEDTLGWCMIMGACCFIMYPVAGLFSVIGCIILATSYETAELGYSFYLCVTSGSLILLLTVCCCCLFCVAAKDDDEPQASRPGYEISTITQGAQVAAPQTDRSSYVFTMVRHIQIVRVIQHYQH